MHLHRALSLLRQSLPSNGDEARVADHAMVRSNGRTIDRPPPHHDLEGLDLNEGSTLIEGLANLLNLGHGREVAHEGSAPLEMRSGGTHDQPGFREVEYDTVRGDLGHQIHDVTGSEIDVVGNRAGKGLDQSAGVNSMVIASFGGDHPPCGANSARQRHGQRSRTGTSFEDGCPWCYVAPRDDWTRILGVEHGCPAFHAKDIIGEAWSDGYDRGLLAGVDRRPFGQSDQLIVGYDPSIELEYGTFPKGDQVAPLAVIEEEAALPCHEGFAGPGHVTRGSNDAISVSTIMATTTQMMILTQRSRDFAIWLSARTDGAAVLHDPDPNVVTGRDHGRVDATRSSMSQNEADCDDSQTDDGLIGCADRTGSRCCPTESDERPLRPPPAPCEYRERQSAFHSR